MRRTVQYEDRPPIWCDFSEDDIFTLIDIHQNSLRKDEPHGTFDEFLDVTTEIIWAAKYFYGLRDKYRDEIKPPSKADAERIKRELQALHRAVDNLSPGAMAHLGKDGEQIRKLSALSRKNKYMRSHSDQIRHFIASHTSTLFREFLIPSSDSRTSDLNDYLSIVVRLSGTSYNIHSLAILTKKTRPYSIFDYSK